MEAAGVHSTDNELIRGIQAGDTEAFEILFKRHSARVYQQVMHLLHHEAEAEEVMQEVFLTVYEKVNAFRGEAAFTTWLYRLAANAALNRLRRRTRRPEVSMTDALPRFAADGHHAVRPVVDWSQDLERQSANRQVCQFLQEAIETLQAIDKAVLVLSDLEGLSNREIADMLGLSVSAVKSRLHRVRLFLRGKLAAFFIPSSPEGHQT